MKQNYLTDDIRRIPALYYYYKGDINMSYQCMVKDLDVVSIDISFAQVRYVSGYCL